MMLGGVSCQSWSRQWTRLVKFHLGPSPKLTFLDEGSSVSLIVLRVQVIGLYRASLSFVVRPYFLLLLEFGLPLVLDRPAALM